jgi:hypothetical protein
MQILSVLIRSYMIWGAFFSYERNHAEIVIITKKYKEQKRFAEHYALWHH